MILRKGYANPNGRSFQFHQRQDTIKIGEEPQDDGSINLILRVAPDAGAHPGNNSFLTSHLDDALSVGFRLMRCPRVAGIRNPDLKPEWFAEPRDRSALREIANKFGEVARRLEGNGAGIAQIKAIGNQYAAPMQTWLQGLASAPPTENGNIAAAVAEWADADSASAHIAFGNDLFCTSDLAKASGPHSTFSTENRDWLRADYRVQFVSLTEMASRI